MNRKNSFDNRCLEKKTMSNVISSQRDKVEDFKASTSEGAMIFPEMNQLGRNKNVYSVQPPQNARIFRQVHQSLENIRREEVVRQMCTKSSLERCKRAKNRRQEQKIKNEALIEDQIIDEAIELEMNKDIVAQIPRKNFSQFVKDVQRRRRKWKDLGFSLEDCPRSTLDH